MLDERLLENKKYVYASIFIESKVPMLIISPEDGLILDANPAALDFYGYSKKRLTEMYIPQINQLGEREVAQEIKNAQQMKRNHFIFKHKLSSGRIRDVEVYSSPIKVESKQYLFSVIHDITTRIEAENQLKIYAKLFTSSNDMLAVIDNEQCYLAANEHYLNMLGLSSEDVIGKKVCEVVDDKTFHFAKSYIQRALEGFPVFYERQNSTLHKVTHLEVRYFLFTDVDGYQSGVVGIFRDISELKENSERISYFAYHDILTGLPNRLKLQERLTLYIERAKYSDGCFYVLFIDLDRFKNVNDSMGHKTGDKLLIEVAGRLERCIRSIDLLSRVSGDEFIVVIEANKGDNQITTILTKIREAFHKPFVVDDNFFHITVSIGISKYPNDSDDLSRLISNADMAMYKAKQQGRNQIVFFSKEESNQLHQYSQIENALRGALERKEFELYFQPQVSIKDKSCSGVEVLLRWTHPELGSISPAIFIPMAEELGLMWELGLWVLQNACKTASDWCRRGIVFRKMAVNVSGVQLRRQDFFQEVVSTLANVGLPSNYLELEITESFVMSQVEQSVEQLHKLRSIGISIAVDDFGTGYSSLSYLKQLPLDKLKIDRSFVTDIDNSNDGQVIALSIIALAKAMRLNVIAEGVENNVQADFLIDNDCEYAQGFLYYRPQSAHG